MLEWYQFIVSLGTTNQGFGIVIDTFLSRTNLFDTRVSVAALKSTSVDKSEGEMMKLDTTIWHEIKSQTHGCVVSLNYRDNGSLQSIHCGTCSKRQ